MLRKTLLVILALNILFYVFQINVFAADDKPSSWAEKEVTAAITEKLVPQALQSKYTQPTTRSEFCALAVTLYENIKGKAITERKTFADTKDINVEKAGGIGVASALGDNKFYPGAKITREHVAIMTARLANALGKPLPKKAATYDDKSSISASALESVGQVQAAGLMVEANNMKFAPKEPYTREQSIVTIMRIYNAVNGEATEPPAIVETSSESGGIDSELLGGWRYTTTNVNATTNIYTYAFNENGTFRHIYVRGTKAYEYEGKYSAYGGKVFLSEINRLTNPNEGVHPVDKTMEYALGTDDKGLFLNIRAMSLNTNNTYADLGTWKFRKNTN